MHSKLPSEVDVMKVSANYEGRIVLNQTIFS